MKNFGVSSLQNLFIAKIEINCIYLVLLVIGNTSANYQ